MSNAYTVFWLLLCGHLLGDFFFQPNSLAQAKKKKDKALFLHVTIYTICIVGFVSPFTAFQNAFAVTLCLLAIFILHLAIDKGKVELCKCADDKTTLKGRVLCYFKKYNFTYDQLLHILSLAVFTAILYRVGGAQIRCGGWGKTLESFYRNLGVPNISLRDFARLLFACLLILKPANIIIRELNPNKSDSYCNPAGRNIGILERILILAFIIVQQYAAIALVLGAKTLTRYDKISKDQKFAEYYLTGTLLSLLIATASGLLVAKMFVPFLKDLKL